MDGEIAFLDPKYVNIASIVMIALGLVGALLAFFADELGPLRGLTGGTDAIGWVQITVGIIGLLIAVGGVALRLVFGKQKPVTSADEMEDFEDDEFPDDDEDDEFPDDEDDDDFDDDDMPGDDDDDGEFEYECPTCGAAVPENASSCPECGEMFEDDEDEEGEEEEYECPTCGAAVSEDTTVCPECGEEFE